MGSSYILIDSLNNYILVELTILHDSEYINIFFETATRVIISINIKNIFTVHAPNNNNRFSSESIDKGLTCIKRVGGENFRGFPSGWGIGKQGIAKLTEIHVSQDVNS